MPYKDPPDTIIYRTVNNHERKILFLLEPMSAYVKAAGVFIIDLSGDRMLNMNLIKSRCKDFMPNICKLSNL